MSNPFDKKFDNAPGVSQRRKEVAAGEHPAARGAVGQQAIDLYRQNRLQELSRYEPIVISLLEKLRDSAYPGYVITSDRGKETHWWRYTPSYWQVCKREVDAHRSPHQSSEIVTERLYPAIGVDLACSDTGIAEQFVVRHYVDNHAHANHREVSQRRELQCTLSEESLTETLIQVHRPSRRVELLKEYHPRIIAMFQELLASNFGILFSGEASISYPSPFDRLKDDPYSVEQYSLGASWRLGVVEQDYPIGVYYKSEYVPDYVTEVEVTLVEDDSHDSSHDRFEVVITCNTPGERQRAQRSTSTDQSELRAAIHNALLELLPKRREYITTLRAKQKKG